MLLHLDLFSGIGGFSLACEWAGIETICFVEIDKYCQKVLRRHWPDVPIVEDIRDVEKIKEIIADTARGRFQQCEVWGETANDSRQMDKNIRRRAIRANEPTLLITGGFPCQPFSVAGKQLSQGDDRYLWPQTIAIIKEIRPKWVLLENVTGIINLALDTVLSDLEGAGYSYETLIVPACAVNAPHRRDRVWIVAHCKGDRMEGGIGSRATWPRRDVFNWSSQDVADTKRGQPREQTQPEGGQDTGRGSEEDVAKSKEQRLSVRIPHTRSYEAGITRPQQDDCWAVEPELCLLADGLSEELDGGINDRTISIGKESAPFCWGKVRRLWFDYLSRSSPHGWRQDKQLAGELANILQRLSYPLALAEWQTTLETTLAYLYRMRQSCEAIGALRNSSVTIDEAWQSLSQEDKGWVTMATARGQWVSEWPNTPRVATGVKNRVDRLKCLGNAIVPQVAYEIIKAIKANDRD